MLDPAVVDRIGGGVMTARLFGNPGLQPGLDTCSSPTSCVIRLLRVARGGGNESDQDLNARHPGCHPFTVARTLPPSGAGRPAIPDHEGCPLTCLDTSDDQSVARPPQT